MFMVPTAGAHSAAAGLSVREKGGEVWVSLLNETGSTLAAGTFVYLTQVQSDTGEMWQMVALSGVDDALKHVAGVVDDDMASSQDDGTPSGDVADEAYGNVKVLGRIVATTPSINPTNGHAIKVLNGDVATAGGVLPYTETSFALWNDTGAATSHDIFLFGREFLATT